MSSCLRLSIGQQLSWLPHAYYLLDYGNNVYMDQMIQRKSVFEVEM